MSAEHLSPPTLLKLHVLLKQALWDWPGKFSALFPRLHLQGVVEVWETAQTCHGWSDCQPLVTLSSAVLDTRQRHCEERVTKYMKSPWNRCIVYCIVLLSTWNIYKIIQIYTRTHSNPWRNQQRRTVSCCPRSESDFLRMRLRVFDSMHITQQFSRLYLCGVCPLEQAMDLISSEIPNFQGWGFGTADDCRKLKISQFFRGKTH